MNRVAVRASLALDCTTSCVREGLGCTWTTNTGAVSIPLEDGDGLDEVGSKTEYKYDLSTVMLTHTSYGH